MATPFVKVSLDIILAYWFFATPLILNMNLLKGPQSALIA